MLLFLLAALAAFAALFLYVIVERQGTAGIPLALLRAVAWGVVAALLLNPALRRLGAPGPTVLLDGSLSMTDPGGDARWRAAVETTASLVAGRSSLERAGRVVVFGDQPRPFRESDPPTASTTLLLPALREAAARGGPIVIVTDGLIDDVGAVPADLLRRAHVVIVPRPEARDAGVAGFDLPAALRGGDTVRVMVDVVWRGGGRGDTATLVLLEQDRVVARARVPLSAAGLRRVELDFVPLPPRGESDVRRYEARLTGFAADAEPRDDVRASAAVVSRGAAIALLSDSPDWDFRWFAQTLLAASGVPVRAYVKTTGDAGGGSWRDARSLRAIDEADVRREASRATLLVLHGTSPGIAAFRRLRSSALIEWPSTEGAAGDWYVAPAEFASPIGAALAGMPAESLPPLESVAEGAVDSVAWTGLLVQQDRRGRSRPVIQGVAQGSRRTVVLSGSGFWRWASRGGAAAEAYRALVASLADWLLEERARAPARVLALRDSLSRGVGEFLPREPVLRAQPGLASAAAGEPVPLRHSGWLYLVAIAALLLEWIARRRQGLG